MNCCRQQPPTLKRPMGSTAFRPNYCLWCRRRSATCNRSRTQGQKLKGCRNGIPLLLPCASWLLYSVSSLLGSVLGRVRSRLAGILHGNGSLLSALFRVFHRYCSAFLGAIVSGLAGI